MSDTVAFFIPGIPVQQGSKTAFVVGKRAVVTDQNMGRTLAREARKTYKACEAAGRWPGYPDDVQTISPPVWAAMAFDERHSMSSEIKV